MSRRKQQIYNYPIIIRKNLIKDKKAPKELDIISQDDFDDLCDKNEEIICVGQSYLMPIKDKEKDKQPDIIIFTDEEGNKSETPIGNDLRGKSLGYLKLSELEYVEVKKKRLLLFLILLIGIIVLCVGIFFGTKGLIGCSGCASHIPEETTNELETEDGTQGTKTPNMEGETVAPEEISIPVYPVIYVTDESYEIPLNNPEENTVFFQYSVYEADTLLYETKAIKPGYYVSWDASGLSVGEHNLTFKLSTYDTETSEPCNGSNIAVKVIRQ